MGSDRRESEVIPKNRYDQWSKLSEGDGSHIGSIDEGGQVAFPHCTGVSILSGFASAREEVPAISFLPLVKKLVIPDLQIQSLRTFLRDQLLLLVPSKSPSVRQTRYSPYQPAALHDHGEIAPHSQRPEGGVCCPLRNADLSHRLIVPCPPSQLQVLLPGLLIDAGWS